MTPTPSRRIGLPSGRMARLARTASSRLPLDVLLRLRRGVLARRRMLAAMCAGLAVLAVGRTVHAPGPTTQPVVVAAVDLAGGSALSAQDMRVVELAASEAPDGSVTTPAEVVGRTLAAPVRAGEPLTDVRTLGPGLVEHYPGTVAIPVRVADAGAVGLLRVGDDVEVLAADPAGGDSAETLGRAPVVAIPRQAAGALTAEPGAGGALVVLAVPPSVANRIAQAAVTRVLSVILVR